MGSPVSTWQTAQFSDEGSLLESSPKISIGLQIWHIWRQEKIMCPIVEMFYLNSTSIDIPVRSLLVRQTSNWSNCSIKGTTARWYSKKHLYQLFLSWILQETLYLKAIKIYAYLRSWPGLELWKSTRLYLRSFQKSWVLCQINFNLNIRFINIWFVICKS